LTIENNSNHKTTMVIVQINDHVSTKKIVR